MIFRRTILAALTVGLLSGLALSLLQVVLINPVLFEAETFEVADVHENNHHDHSHDGHSHHHEGWSPEDGAERTLVTVASNIFAGVGFAAVLLSIMSQLQIQHTMSRTNVMKGLAWGFAGFLVFFVAPGVGLPPEIPGIEAAAIEHRQVWWLLTVCCTGLGLLILAFASMKFKLLSMVFIALPHALGAPHQEGPLFTHPDANAVATLQELHQQFIIYSGVGNFVFWLVIGACSAYMLNHFILRGVSESGELSVG